jgi:uracil phosphoribosyltransferase
MLFVIGEQNSVANQFLLELRDQHWQTDRSRFRNNLERLGKIMAYEISKHLHYIPQETITPLGRSVISVLERQPVLISILRAGLSYFTGFQNFFDQADSGFIGAYRQEGEDELVIKLDYLATPPIDGKDVILIDPMLATGHSAMEALNALLKKGTPRNVFFASLVSAPEGIAHITREMKILHSIFTFAVDEKLNNQFYIVPGLGDAGDLSFGKKM